MYTDFAVHKLLNVPSTNLCN